MILLLNPQKTDLKAVLHADGFGFRVSGDCPRTKILMGKEAK